MKKFVLIINFMFSAGLIYCQNFPELYNSHDSTNAPTRNLKNSQDTSYIEYQRSLEININPIEAKDASITLIKKSRILIGHYSKTTFEISPDTLGNWKAPLSLILSTGDYDLVVKKEGFRDVHETIELTNNSEDNLELEMLSLEYLRQKKAPWKIAKYISAVVFLGAGIASLYFQNKINKYKNDYDNSSSPSAIKDAKNNIDEYNSYYKISTGIAVAALGSVALTWAVEISF